VPFALVVRVRVTLDETVALHACEHLGHRRLLDPREPGKLLLSQRATLCERKTGTQPSTNRSVPAGANSASPMTTMRFTSPAIALIVTLAVA